MAFGERHDIIIGCREVMERVSWAAVGSSWCSDRCERAGEGGRSGGIHSMHVLWAPVCAASEMRCSFHLSCLDCANEVFFSSFHPLVSRFLKQAASTGWSWNMERCSVWVWEQLRLLKLMDAGGVRLALRCSAAFYSVSLCSSELKDKKNGHLKLGRRIWNKSIQFTK